MNKSILLAALAVTLLPSVHAQTAAPASTGVLSNLSVNGTLDLESQYIFRGKKITNAALQPSANITYGNVAGGSITGYMWTSQPIGREGNAAGPDENNEIDLGIKYDNTLPSNAAVSYEVGAQMYWYPNKSGTTGWLSRSYELHVGVGYDTTDLFNNMGWGKYNIQPFLTYYHDLILDSNTLNLQVASYTFDLSDWTGLKGLSLTPTATIGWTGINRVDGDQDEGAAGPGFHWANSYIYYELDLELDYKPNNSGTTTFFTGVHYAGNNDGNTGGPAPFGLADPQAPGSDNSIWFGFGIKFNQ
ncbi:MAG TPA: hypothetical protein VK737_01930 [Opitutales bacterium]|nr:hypothetical protein [Opitutales bacterium]